MDKKSVKMDLDEGQERRVPIALVLAVLLQIATIIWWASGKERDVFFIEQRVNKLETDVVQETSGQAQMLDRLARIEERLNAQLRLLDQIEKQIHR